jgi:hypothetical protein
MRVKDLRLLLLVTGELDEATYQSILKRPRSDIAAEILGLVHEQQITVEIIGTEAKMFTCESCGVTFDLDDDEEEEDITCSECGIGPMCPDCFDGHICEETGD